MFKVRGKYEKPHQTFKLIELALEHPQSLYNALNALPFKIEIAMYNGSAASSHILRNERKTNEDRKSSS